MSTIMLESRTTVRDTKRLLNAVKPKVAYLPGNVADGGSLWEREIALLLRDSVEVRSLAERILDQAVAYLITAMENPDAGFSVDDELWAVDGSDCSPCNDKVPDSH
ncbi:hypothetical protein [Streptomyces aidingensis]|uniref:Uncharacterized protein n=1 Tax=Streptomyces aidingensis TaxID=910347 RepID=A0A1I1LJ44_9ACTN|nr:hypothetical protein [Streptomyces aidingensis]SFC72582.1 hypothetical protein SAMN05421773_105234 [Streptomyces aidingensis]